MTYRLAKDIPFAKKGTPIAIIPEGCLPLTILHSTEIRIAQDKLNMMLKDGWIEEVKPREWKILVSKEGSISNAKGMNRENINEYWEIVEVQEKIK